jgi:hypothetical protein
MGEEFFVMVAQMAAVGEEQINGEQQESGKSNPG